MKRYLLVLAIFFMALSLVSCATDFQGEDINTISEAQLTDREKSLLSAANEHFFVFDYHIDSEYKKISAWVEKYEFGKKVESATGKIFLLNSNRDGTIVFTANEASPSSSEVDILFGISIINGGGSSKTSSLQKSIIEDKDKGFGITWSSNIMGETPIKGKMILANIIYDEGGQHMSGLQIDDEGNLEGIEGYDAVYVLRCELIRW